MADLGPTIEAVAGNPKKITGDAGSTEEHPLTDLIAADRYLATKTAAAAGGSGLVFFKMIPPGATQ